MCSRLSVAYGGIIRMRSGRDGDSIWMTSAPISAKYIVAKGPGKSVEKSRTLSPFNAVVIVFLTTIIRIFFYIS